MKQRLVRALDLALHRLRVGHGIPAPIAPFAGVIDRLTRGAFDQHEHERIDAESRAVQASYHGVPIDLVVDRVATNDPLVEIPFVPIAGPIRCRARALAPETLARIAARLASDGLAAVRAIPISRILDILDRASTLWLDPKYPPRALAIEAIHRITGFSRQMVIYSIDLEMRSSRKLDLWHTLITELGNPRVLDGRRWTPTGEAPARAFGPSLLAAVFSSNIPALPHLTYMRALAVKAPVIGKVATFEPVFAGLYIDTLVELCPELAPALASVWFPGGTPDLERALFERADHVIAYGSEPSLRALAANVPGNARRTLHGHRMGIGCIARDHATADVARAIAYDVAVFDGQACLAPAVYFVEGALDDATALARAVGSELARIAAWLPRRELSVDDRAARRAIVDRWELRALVSDAHVIRPQPLAWAATITTGRYRPEPYGDRLVHIHRVDSLDDVPAIVAPYQHALQNVAIAASDARRLRLGEALAELGASRITRPGLMPTPSMMWHHDGRTCLADLLRWADIA